MRKCNQKATGFFALTVGVTSSGFKIPNKKDLIANQRAFEVENAMWAEGAKGAAGAKRTGNRGSKDVQEACVEDVDTITV